GCSLQGDKYVLFNCDCCGNTQCKECGDFTASEEKCFPLMKRRVLLYCPQCRKEAGNIEQLMQRNRKLKQEINTLKEKILKQKNKKVAMTLISIAGEFCSWGYEDICQIIGGRDHQLQRKH
ncbi:hypothetical protein WA026_021012, partial [Henosepilachna vigintioctopunctata]